MIFCEGLGAVTPAIDAGTPAPAFSNVRTVNAATVTIGGVSAPVSFAGLAPGFVGLYQINAMVPAGVSGDALPVVVTVAGRSSSGSVTMAVR